MPYIRVVKNGKQSAANLDGDLVDFLQRGLQSGPLRVRGLIRNMTVSGTPILDLQGWQALLDKELG